MKKEYLVFNIALILTIAWWIYLYRHYDGQSEDFQTKNMKIVWASMEPTLHNNSYVDIVLNPHKIHRWDIVAFRIKTRGDMIKRVIAVPWDNVIFGKDWFIYINQIKQVEAYIKWRKFPREHLAIILTQLNHYGWKIPNNMYLVLGDNRDASLDSTEYGLIDWDQIIGYIKKD